MTDKMEDNKKIYTIDQPMSFEPIHPGEMLLDELNARGISQRQFAKLIGCSRSFLNEIIKGKRSITTATAFRIEAATGTKAYIWVNLQTVYDMQTARNDKQLTATLTKIRTAAKASNMVRA